jgi:DNA-binding response OmpR family regulator
VRETDARPDRKGSFLQGLRDGLDYEAAGAGEGDDPRVIPMRPAKRVLVLGADELLVSRLVLVLESRLYTVLRAHSAAEALAILSREPVDSLHVLLVELPLPGIDQVWGLARGCHPEMRVLVRSDQFHPPVDTAYDVWLPHSAGIAEMLERIHVLVARKRGPKKAVQTVGVLSESERRMA